MGEDYLATEVRINKPKGRGVESVWLNVKKRVIPNTLVGVLYITPQARNLEGFQKQALEFLQDKQREGLEIVIRGDFNAHFKGQQVGLDN